MTRSQSKEEPDDGNLSSPVLKTSSGGDSWAEFNWAQAKDTMRKFMLFAIVKDVSLPVCYVLLLKRSSIDKLIPPIDNQNILPLLELRLSAFVEIIAYSVFISLFPTMLNLILFTTLYVLNAKGRIELDRYNTTLTGLSLHVPTLLFWAIMAKDQPQENLIWMILSMALSLLLAILLYVKLDKCKLVTG